tara:strand:+ start:325 stop:468 length:144 start_codon:yes stop_codon:yes gene_type:complete
MKKPLSIEVMVSSDDKKKLKTKADALGMSLSGYLRFVGLGAKIEVSR